MKKIAVVGAGLTGLVLASRLRNVAAVEVFDKSSRLGGRMSTRVTGGFSFDHGAQYFTAKSGEFKQFLNPFLESGTVAQWDAKLVRISTGECIPVERAYPTYVAVPGMNALATSLGENLNVHRSWHVDSVFVDGGKWQLTSKQNEKAGPFDWLISTLPAPQAQELLKPLPFLDLNYRNASMLACFSLMYGFSEPLDLPFDGAFFEDDILGFTAVNSSKPGRQGGFSLLVQTQNSWAQENLDISENDLKSVIRAKLITQCGIDVTDAVHNDTHRWLYASTSQAAGQPFLMDESQKLVVAGDWCVKGRVEAAFESGTYVAEKLLKTFQ